MTRIGLCFLILLAACTISDDDYGDGAGDGDGAGAADAAPDFEAPAASEDWTRDLLSTGLELDIAGHIGKATIAIAASDSTGASFEIGDLAIDGVVDLEQHELDFDAHDGQLDVGVPAAGDTATIVIGYHFQDHDAFDGWMPGQGVTFLWPYFCGNLYPCKSDPADGQSFTMAVGGVSEGVAVFPENIPADAPTYMPAIAVADFTEVELGTTTAGTQLSVWHLPGAQQEEDAAAGTAHLVDVFDFYERTYGPYTFGSKAGTVSADWGGGDYGGMEHHPYWHVSSGSLYSEEVNAHEAAHGWFGNGVRIACWEDFVLSEGLATYLAAHALEQSGVNIWQDYECGLKYTCQAANNTVALPDTCNSIDILNDPLWSLVPYMKGAYFLKTVGRRIGAAKLDESLATFYQNNVGKAAKMDDLIDQIKADNPGKIAFIDAQADKWLRQLACPIQTTNLCN